MKASLKFREEQKPLFKAKVPLNILGLPFQSTLSGGDTKELCLTLGTFFESGPAFRFSYRPNDAFNPFSLVIKTGIGHFGSPVEAPMTMSAEFNFASGNSNSTPVFSLHFKPQFGDFTLKKSQRSKGYDVVLGDDEEDSSIEVVEKPMEIAALPLKSSMEEAISGMELGAKTSLPIRNGAMLKLRWGVRFPEGFQNLFNRKKDNSTAGISPRGMIPLLVLNKIGIEHVAKEDKKEDADVADTCFSVKRQLETLRSENALLGNALEDLRAEFGRGHRGERKSPEFEGVVVVDDISKV